MESPLPGDRHCGFGERPGLETDREQSRHRAPGRLNYMGLDRPPLDAAACPAWPASQVRGGASLTAPNENVAPSRSFLTKYLVTSWDYRHPSVLAGVRLAIGIWLVVLSVLLFSIDGWWAAPLLVVAAALCTTIFYVLRIVQGQPADPSAAGRDGTTQTM